MAAAAEARLKKPQPRYSNLGFQLLGHAVAARAGLGYEELVQERIAGPLGLTSFYVPTVEDDLRPQSLTGVSRRGRARPPWFGAALGPAGGVRATIEDMAVLTGALLDGSAPGIRALDPVADFARNVQVGAGWMTIEIDGGVITWHNGGTGGFRSWMGIDRRAGTGVVVLSARYRSVDAGGFKLLSEV